MDKNQIQPILQEALEEKIPSPEISLWNAVKTRLVTHKKIAPRTRRVLRVAFATILFAVLVLFITPQGRAWAQTLLRFFERAESNTLPLSTPQSPEPIWGLSVAKAEELAGFKVRVPACVPPGYGLKTVIFNPQNGAVIQLYEFSPRQAGESFALIQSPTRPNDLIGSNATVETLDIGGTAVEYVSGMWFSGVGSDTEQWISGQPVHTFIWQEADFYFTLQFLVDETFSPAYLSQQDMTTEIEAVMGLRTSWPDKVNLNYLTSYDAVEKAAGFDILTPSVLPEGFIFNYGVYEPENQRAVLIYRSEDGLSDDSLVIFEIAGATPAVSWDGFPAGSVEAVSIGVTTGTFIRGAIVDSVYDPDFGLSIIWQIDGLYVQVRFTGGGSPVQLEEDAMLAIARSMR
jgi:hypothetical protein